MARRSYLLAALSVALALASVFGPDSGLLNARPRTTLAAPLAAPDNSIVLQLVLSGLSTPVFITHAGDNTGRLFVVELGGVIKIVKNGQVNGTPFLDIRSLVVAGGEQGLLGLAFHPNYENNGRFFVFYTAKVPGSPTPSCPGNCGDNTLAEYHVDEDNPDIADPVPVRTLFALPDEFNNHNGGMLGFSPVDPNDAFLYVSTGDEGSGGDPHDNAQNLNSLYGKILRLDVDNIPSGQPYGIPPSNPFVGQSSVRPEIWAYGFRNPWRWSFDRLTGDMFIGDVGQGSWEEIDRIPSLLSGPNGRNFGWDDREGAHCFEPSTNCLTAGRIDPILEYSRASNGPSCASITGGYRYRGSENPALQGIYFYADFCSGRIWKGIVSGAFWGGIEALDTNHGISSFGEDQNGELYVVALGGSIFRVAQAASPPVADCRVRPKVTLQTTQTAAGTLRVILTANDSTTVTNNVLQNIAFNHIVNGSVTIGTQDNRTSPFTVNLPTGSTSAQFTATRAQAGKALHVDFSVTDRCGPWQTFVGGGPAMP
jgi:glucose/arabinose dehydrogenase